MIAFEVFLNGKRLTLAGAEDLGVLNAIVTAAGVLGAASVGTKGQKRSCDLHLHVGGLTARGGEKDDEHLLWLPDESLKAGDEVLVRVVETSESDTPQQRYVNTGCGVRQMSRNDEDG